jgi:NAD(P)-dependent dehydrogenase (short-subunit alcohol dehydrogenase family)
MHGRLHGKIALIIEGDSEIAAAAAVRFAREGARVALCGRDAESLEEAATAVADAGGSAYVLQADPSHDAQLSAALEQAIGQFGTLDVLICCPPEPSGERRARPDLAASKALVTMAARGGGSIVLVAIPAGASGRSGGDSSLSSLESTARRLASEGAPRAVRVNVVAPGLVATERMLAGFTDPTGRKNAEQSVPLGRLGRPDEIAAAIAFLASEDAGYITGVTVAVDGGYSAAARREH